MCRVNMVAIRTHVTVNEIGKRPRQQHEKIFDSVGLTVHGLVHVWSCLQPHTVLHLFKR